MVGVEHTWGVVLLHPAEGDCLGGPRKQDGGGQCTQLSSSRGGHLPRGCTCPPRCARDIRVALLEQRAAVGGSSVS